MSAKVAIITGASRGIGAGLVTGYRRAVDRALERFGRIDTLVNNAGVYIGKPFTDYTLEDYAAITAVNLTGFFHITQIAIAQMVEQGAGHVVNISTSLVDRAGCPPKLAPCKGG